MAKSFKVPHTLVLLFAMILLAFAATFVLPQGAFDTVDHDGHESVVPGSYTPDAERKLLAWHVPFSSIPKGFAAAQGIIFFVFIIGGAFGVFRASGAADALIGKLLELFGDTPAVLIFGAMFIFAAGSSTIGMAEEYLPFVPMLLALCTALGFDAVVAIGVLCCGYGIGYGTAILNPFTVFIAWDIAGVQQGSGMAFRLVLGAVMLAVGFHHVWSYAKRVKANPEKSLLAGTDRDMRKQAKTEFPVLNGNHLIILGLLAVTLVAIVLGIREYGWYLTELGAIFLGAAIVMGFVARLGPDSIAKHFCEGAGELTTTALLIGFARTIEEVLKEGRVIDTIINAIAQPLEAMGPHIAAIGMFVVQSLCNLFIPSGSGQAYVTMPIMAPLADLVGVSRQISVLAYQFGDGFTNIVVPTNAVLIGILGLAGIPYDRWLRFVFPFLLKIWVVAAIAMVIAVTIGF